MIPCAADGHMAYVNKCVTYLNWTISNITLTYYSNKVATICVHIQQNFGISNLRLYRTTVNCPATINANTYKHSSALSKPAYIEVSLLSNATFGPCQTVGLQTLSKLQGHYATQYYWTISEVYWWILNRCFVSRLAKRRDWLTCMYGHRERVSLYVYTDLIFYCSLIMVTKWPI